MRTLLLRSSPSRSLAAPWRAPTRECGSSTTSRRTAVKQKYGFDVTDAWLEHLRSSSVRFNNGGSGSFVSADGLVMTNHHVGADMLQKISTPEKDYYKDGFFAEVAAPRRSRPPTSS